MFAAIFFSFIDVLVFLVIPIILRLVQNKILRFHTTHEPILKMKTRC